MIEFTIKFMESIGFTRTAEYGGTVYERKFSGIDVLVTILPDGRWRPQIMMSDDGDIFIFYDLQNIKDLTDLEDFISYL